VIKHRQLARQIWAFSAIAFESSVDLEIKTRCGSHRPSSTTRRVDINVTCGDSVPHGGVRRRPSASLQPDSASGVQEQTNKDHLFKSKAELKSRLEVQFSVSANHQVRADVRTNRNYMLLCRTWIETELRSSLNGSKFRVDCCCPTRSTCHARSLLPSRRLGPMLIHIHHARN
jgi:hypothetical protein